MREVNIMPKETATKVDFTRRNLETLISLGQSVDRLEKKIDHLEDVGPFLKSVSLEQSRLDSSVSEVTRTLKNLDKKIDVLEHKVDGIQKYSENKLEDKKSRRLLWTAVLTAFISAVASIVVVIVR